MNTLKQAAVKKALTDAGFQVFDNGADGTPGISLRLRGERAGGFYWRSDDSAPDAIAKTPARACRIANEAWSKPTIADLASAAPAPAPVRPPVLTEAARRAFLPTDLAPEAPPVQAQPVDWKARAGSPSGRPTGSAPSTKGWGACLFLGVGRFSLDWTHVPG